MDRKLSMNVFAKSVEALVMIVASSIQLAAITRTYQLEMVGQYQLVMTWLFFISALSCFAGIVMIATRDLANGQESDVGAIFSSAIALQSLVAIPLAIIALLVFLSTEYFAPIAIPLSIGTFSLLGAMILQQSQALLISNGRIVENVIASVAGHCFATIALLIAARSGYSTSTLVTAWASYYVVSGLVMTRITSAWDTFSIALIERARLKALAYETLPVLVMVLATHLYVRIDIIMLDRLTSKEVVAQYGAAYLFLDQLMILSNFMMSALFPNFARTCVSHAHEFRVLYRGILRLFLKYLVPLAACIALFSASLLTVLYGSAYSAVWSSLCVLMGASLAAWLNGPSGTIFISLKKQYIYMWATLLSLLVNVAGNVLLIPEYGALGAALATLGTECTLCTFCLWWIHKHTGYLPWMKPSQ